eukprot:m.240332 g.240332  ORF g.240332 m.240332 type:complete len:61 (-) comp19411_c0_seq1:415-597(-)
MVIKTDNSPQKLEQFLREVGAALENLGVAQKKKNIQPSKLQQSIQIFYLADPISFKPKAP